MKRNLEVGLFIFVLICLSVSLFFNRENYLDHQSQKLMDKHQKEAERVRDSLINFRDHQLIIEGTRHRVRADSIQAYLSIYVKADSINIYKTRHAKAQIPHYTPSQRSAALDSIARANGGQGGTR